MKIRWLRRFRKHYSWHYDRERLDWVLFDKRSHKKIRRKEAFIIIGFMMGDYFSFGQMIDYIKRKERILDKKEYSKKTW